MINKKLLFDKRLVYTAFFLVAVAAVCIMSSNKASAVVDNFGGIHPNYRAYNNGNAGTTGNYYCINPGDPAQYPYQFQGWWSLGGNPLAEVPDSSVVVMPSGTDATSFDMNIIANHCTTNMVGAPPPVFTSQLKTPQPQNFAQITTFNFVSATVSNTSLTMTREATAYKDLNWYDTYAPSYGSYANLFYVPPISYRMTISGFNALPVGDHNVGIRLNTRTVTAFGNSTLAINNYRCVSPPRDYSSNGANGINCPEGADLIFVTFRKAPPPDICTNIPGNQATVPAPYSDPDGDKICDQPDNAPTITFTEVCDNVNNSYYINVVTSDPDGGTSAVSYNGTGFATTSQTSNSFNLTRDPTATVDLYASTNGVYPSYYRSAQSATAGRTSYGPCIYPFTLGPSSSIPTLDDDELPTKINSVSFTTTYSSTSPNGVNAITPNRQTYVLKGGALNLPYIVGPEVGNVNFTATVVDTRVNLSLAGRNLTAGDAVCSLYNINHTAGYVDRNGNTINNAAYPLAGASANTAQCRSIVDRPYLKTYGADVVAGSGFGVNCTSAPADITSFARFVSSPLSGYVGGGSQLGVFASGTINGFVSMSMRDALGATAVPAARTFSNQIAGSFGGNYGVKFCSDDFWASKGILNPDNRALNALPTGKYTYSPGTLNIAAGVGGSISNKIAIYVDGDVTIDKNLTYRTTSNWASVNAIPSIYIIARGNIYINANVTQLDGLYVAQPSAPGVGGQIITCAENGAYPSNATILGACRTNQLKINGAFIADSVKFTRTKGTVRSAVSPIPVPPATCTAANPVIIYSDWKFMGASRALAQGTYNTATDTSPLGYRQISSVKVPAGCRVLLEDSTSGSAKELLSDWTVNDSSSYFNDATTMVTVSSIPVSQKQLGLLWSFTGPIEPANYDCVLFNETADIWWTGIYADNYLCARKSYNLGLSFHSAGPAAGKTCILINEPGDVNTWSDNYLCSNTNLGLQFSYGYPIAGTYCTQAVFEPGDTHQPISWWLDNYICEPLVPAASLPTDLSGEEPASANIAESFDFSPELLIAPPGINPDDSKSFDSIVSLPPTL